MSSPVNRRTLAPLVPAASPLAELLGIRPDGPDSCLIARCRRLMLRYQSLPLEQGSRIASPHFRREFRKVTSAVPETLAGHRAKAELLRMMMEDPAPTAHQSPVWCLAMSVLADTLGRR